MTQETEERGVRILCLIIGALAGIWLYRLLWELIRLWRLP